MREIQASTVTEAVARLCIQACTVLPEDVKARIYNCRETETWPTARDILGVIIENFATNGPIPLGQETYMMPCIRAWLRDTLTVFCENPW